jgi:hypothetical protein
MPVTNFQSVISAQSVGTADVQALAASFDKLSGSIDGATQKANKVNEHPGFNAFAEKVKQGIENPLQAIGGAAEDALKSMGPLGSGMAAVGGAFVAAAAAGFEAAKALGEYGVQIRDVELRTGLAAKEVGQYSFAAKAVGQDVSILDRMMRGLTMAVEDNTTKGEKARVWLTKWGVDVAGLKDGTASTSEALQKVGAGLEGLPAGIGRTSAAIDVFKRAGIEAIPFLVELNSNLKIAQEQGFGPNEESLTRFKEYQKEVTILGTKWAELKRSAMEPIAFTLLWTIKKAGDPSLWETPWIAKALFSGTPSGTTTEMGETGGWGYGASMSRSAHTGEADSLAYNNARVAAAQSGGTDAEKLSKAKQRLTELQGALKTNVLPSANTGTFDDIAKQRDVIAGIEARIAATKRLADAVKEAIAAIEKQTKADDDYTAKLLKGGRQLYLNANPAEAPAQWSAQQSWMLTGPRRSTSTQNESDLMAWWKGEQASQAKSGEQDLKDARDSERRGLSLYGASSALGGGSEIGQINGAEALRKAYADQEYAALRKIADAKNDEDLKESAIDQQHQKYLDAEIERQQALLQLALRQKEEFQNLAVGLFQSALHGGTTNYLKQQGTGILDKVVGNAAGMAWGDISKIVPHASGPLGNLLQGTMFGPDPMKAATDLNTQATIDNTRALMMSRTGGGGGRVGGSGLGSLAGIGRVTGTGGGVGYPANDPYGWMSGAGGPSDYDPSSPDTITPEGAAWGDNFWASNPTGGGMSSLAKYAGIGGTLAAGGFGLYSGIKAGGTQGDLTAVGSGLGMAGGIVSMLIPKLASTLGPIGMALGMGLGLVSTLLGDPKQNRAKDLTTQAQQRQFTMPTGVDYELSSSGGYEDYNYRGQSRTTVVNNVYAMDSKSFNDYLIANPSALSNGITSAIAGGNADDVVSSIAARVNP